ncbi:DUF2000 domain-containing protein [Streptomyces mirabilis]|uniref:DUF2000 domain-containing protein n=1 Tax=Streptomyces mirabilis TaxID=68239 RepID=UPI00371E4852
MTDMPVGDTTHKFVVVINKKLESGVALNACAHMAATLVSRADEEHTQEMTFVDYTDGSGNIHPVSALSLIVLSAKNGNQIRTARELAVIADLHFVDFTESMTQDTYVEQMERTSKIREEDLDYWGLCMFGPKEKIDPITKRFSLWRS